MNVGQKQAKRLQSSTVHIKRNKIGFKISAISYTLQIKFNVTTKHMENNFQL